MSRRTILVLIGFMIAAWAIMAASFDTIERDRRVLVDNFSSDRLHRLTAAAREVEASFDDVASDLDLAARLVDQSQSGGEQRRILTALVGVGVTISSVIVTSQIITVSSTAPTLAEMLGLAVGIDYALFILSRYRTQLADGLDPVESMSRALATAGSAVVFAGTTVTLQPVLASRRRMLRLMP